MSDLRMLALALMLGAGSVVLLTGCESDGPAEEMGESIDETAEEAGDEMEEATD
ncbi:hypothetical protein [Algiphilus aromaticivorans]|uniref:hypothetical protein n=1 Tax=Algiphilus aromaticivorans TaxID=382454 RepID=UPI0018DD6DC6|nr:hypothetical protein [Algiphilus aromaticivorans]